MQTFFDELEYLIANPDVSDAIKLGIIDSGESHFNHFGLLENRLLFDPNKSKAYKALFSLDQTGLGLEIGPSINPIAPKSAGFNVHVLDHLSTEDLIQKYKDHGVNTSNIENVDYVWSGEKLTDLIGGTNRYDWIIASHVVEHIPNLIGFLQECSLLLKEHGKLSLVIPDKQYCFDYFLPLTTTGQLIDAYDSRCNRPTRGQVFDSYSHSSSMGGTISWDNSTQGKLELIHTLGFCKDTFRQMSADKTYIDTHCWKFIPKSFQLIINDLNFLELIDLKIENGFNTRGCEFFFTLAKGSMTDYKERLNALMEIKKGG